MFAEFKLTGGSGSEFIHINVAMINTVAICDGDTRIRMDNGRYWHVQHTVVEVVDRIARAQYEHEELMAEARANVNSSYSW